MVQRGHFTRFGLVTALASLGAATSLYAAVHEVPGTYSTIQAAINAAAPGDVIVLADGVYSGEGNRNIDFMGKAITLRSANGSANCVIDVNAIPGTPYRGFIFQHGETATSVLEGVTITRGATLTGAVADQFNGGGILCTSSSPTIRDCVLSNNDAACWGGGICCTHASPIITGCTIVGNTTGDEGGGVFAWNNSYPTIRNTVIAYNVADSIGGGILNFGGAGFTVENCTIYGNEASWGAGMYAPLGVISNSIVRGNISRNGGREIEGGTVNVSYSNVQGGWTGTGNIDADPLFVDAANGDFHLTADSPCVDAGNPAATYPAGSVDMDNEMRVWAAGSSQVVDMGADEFGSFVFGDTNCDGATNNFDIDAFVTAMTSAPDYAAQYPGCNRNLADVNHDGLVNNFDIDSMVALLSNQ